MKKVIVFLLALVMVFVLAACTTAPANSAPAADAAPADKPAASEPAKSEPAASGGLIKVGFAQCKADE